MKRVAVLFGGISSEREVSLVSGRECCAALREAGYEVVPVEVTSDLPALVAALTPKPDAVFNALHGRFGEDGAIQGVLDWLDIPYTHSGVRASAAAMDKVASRTLFEAAGLPVPRGRVIDIGEIADHDPLVAPYVIKPVNEGSSVGVDIVRPGDNKRGEILSRWHYGPQALVEEFVPGRELTIGVLEDRALTITDIEARLGAFYDYDSKYADGGSRHILPAVLDKTRFEEALALAVAAGRALGCRGAFRADLRYDDTAGEPGRLVLLEVNTQPGLTPTSLLPEQAKYCAISFPELCAWMVERAACRV